MSESIIVIEVALAVAALAFLVYAGWVLFHREKGDPINSDNNTKGDKQ